MKYRIIGRLGDVDPIEYGGGAVFTDGKNRWLEYTHGREELSWDDLSVEKLEVYQVDIDDDVLDWHDWVKLKDLASYTGLDEEELLEYSKGTLNERAQLLSDIASYYGWYELDQYPLRLHLDAIEERWRLR
jgi:hypothetical protein